jgi:RNA polymerase sigma-70 factor (ECF subfamily)
MSSFERPDGDWARLAQRGDAKAYEVLVRRHQDRVYRHLLHMTGSREDALELAQDVFIKGWQALPAWRPEAQFHTWLLRIASNAALDVLRRRTVVRFEALADDYDAPAEGPGPQAQLEAKQRLGALDAALAGMTAEHREVLLLREVEGLSYSELAQVLAIDEGTVKSRLARARAALAARYERGDT